MLKALNGTAHGASRRAACQGTHLGYHLLSPLKQCAKRLFAIPTTRSYIRTPPRAEWLMPVLASTISRDHGRGRECSATRRKA